ncbi:putative inactive tRNA-specific adenosine deaminase-like protein 3 [Sarcoptes scabiei]|nr:putative inactive tRNA-specific adenosine deaminase-like protein 3 [Sarcoptes scabiei]
MYMMKILIPEIYNNNAIQTSLENLYIADVPISRPLTKNQFLKTSQLWPVCFHEDKYIADCLNGAVFSPVRLENIHQLMDHTLSLLDNQMNGNCSAIITRRNGKQIVAEGISEIDKNPLNHATIIAISKVSEIHKRFKMNPLEKSIGEQSQESTNDDQIYQNDYLCTDYECFLSQEPCLMCAMALIHSRIRRVFFYSSINSEISISCNDKAYSIHQLHFNSKLNHRHEVWQLIKRENHRKLDCDQPSLNNKKKLKFFKN